MKKIITLLLIAFLSTNCSGNDDDTTQNPVVGTWKLMKTEKVVFTGTTGTVSTDHSSQNIIYKFDSKANLTITNGTDVKTSKYEYKFDYLSENSIPGKTKLNIVVIDGSKYLYSLVDGQMKLDESYVDGETLYLKKQ